jgi:polyhydroxybutyrate depolymerase
MHNGLEREYLLFVPSGYDPAMETPLVLNLHGVTSNGPEQMAISGMNPVAEQEGFLVAYPSAVGGDWGDDNPDVPGADHNISFIDSLVDTITSDYTVDANRVYSTGLSQGGMMSQMLAAVRPYTFAAVASVAAVRPFSTGLAEPADSIFPPYVPPVPSRPFPLLHIGGTADVVVPYEGGNLGIPGLEFIEFRSVESMVAEWAANNGSSLAPSITELPDTYADDGSTVTLFSYDDTATYTTTPGVEQSADILFYRVNGGGHSWPVDPGLRPPFSDAIAFAFPINSDINASSVIWDFFSQHQLAAIPEPTSLSLAGLAVVSLLFALRRRPHSRFSRFSGV